MGTAELDLAADRPMSSRMHSSVHVLDVPTIICSLQCFRQHASPLLSESQQIRFPKELVHAACTAAETPPDPSSVAMSQVHLA